MSMQYPGRGGEETNVTILRLDPIINPPQYVEEELPTRTVTLRTGRGGKLRAPHGTEVGSYRITGSHRDLGAPGTFGLRITRLSVFAGSRETTWFIRHSRTGTVDTLYFPSAGQQFSLGDQNKPIYSFGPGSVIWGFENAGSAYDLGAHMEGIVSHE